MTLCPDSVDALLMFLRHLITEVYFLTLFEASIAIEAQSYSGMNGHSAIILPSFRYEVFFITASCLS